MFYRDLGRETEIVQGEYVRAVGWLDAGHAFPTGSVGNEGLERISAYAQRWAASVIALGWPVSGGPHTCHLCGAFRASGNFGVPDGDVLFVCPEMISHYVALHSYLPPPEFLSAIRRAPLPESPEYDAAVSRFARASP